MEPNWDLPYFLLGMAHCTDVMAGWSDSPEQSVQKPFQFAEKAISLNESFHAHALLCSVYTLTRQHEKALEEGAKSIALAPNSADAHAWYASAQIFAGHPTKGIQLVEKALRLNPFPPSWYFHVQGAAYRYVGRYDDAISAFKKALSVEPSNLFGAIGLTIVYALSGRQEEAKAQGEEVLRMDPAFSFESYLGRVAYPNQEEIERTIESLRKAGFKVR